MHIHTSGQLLHYKYQQPHNPPSTWTHFLLLTPIISLIAPWCLRFALGLAVVVLVLRFPFGFALEVVLVVFVLRYTFGFAFGFAFAFCPWSSTKEVKHGDSLAFAAPVISIAPMIIVSCCCIWVVSLRTVVVKITPGRYSSRLSVHSQDPHLPLQQCHKNGHKRRNRRTEEPTSCYAFMLLVSTYRTSQIGTFLAPFFL